MLHLVFSFEKSALIKSVNSNGYGGLEDPHDHQTTPFLPNYHIFFDLQLLFHPRHHMSVLTYPSLCARGYCRSHSTDSKLEAVQPSRRKGHHWNSFQGRSAVCSGRCMFSHTLLGPPLKSGGCSRSRQAYLQGAAKKGAETPWVGERVEGRGNKSAAEWALLIIRVWKMVQMPFFSPLTCKCLLKKHISHLV